MCQELITQGIALALHAHSVGWLDDTPYLRLAPRSGASSYTRMIRQGQANIIATEDLLGFTRTPTSWVSTPDPVPLTSPVGPDLLVADYRVSRAPDTGASHVASLLVRLSQWRKNAMRVEGWLECDGYVVSRKPWVHVAPLPKLARCMADVWGWLLFEAQAVLSDTYSWVNIDDSFDWVTHCPNGADCLLNLVRTRLGTVSLSHLTMTNTAPLAF